MSNGHGIFSWTGNEKYEGEWKEGKMDGYGIINFSDGINYEGEWKDGTRHGEGTFTSSDGSKWVGEFKNDKIWNITNFDSSGKIIEKWFHGIKQ